MSNKRKKRRKVKKQAIFATLLFLSGTILFGRGLVQNKNNNSVRNELLDKSTSISCHVTSVTERTIIYHDTDNDIIKDVYSLVGTYDNNGEKAVITLNEAYTDKTAANEQINTDRDVYIDTNMIGVAGAMDVVIPDKNTSANDDIRAGAVIMMAGIAVLFIPKGKAVKAPTLQSARKGRR